MTVEDRRLRSNPRLGSFDLTVVNDRYGEKLHLHHERADARLSKPLLVTMPLRLHHKLLPVFVAKFCSICSIASQSLPDTDRTLNGEAGANACIGKLT